MIQTTALPLPGLLLLQPRVYADERGYFFEVNRSSELKQSLGDIDFVQESQSGSFQHVLRGLHYQLDKPQAKLIRVLTGRIFDVVVDLRRQSASFGQWFGLELCSDKRQQLFIPAGFAHGFLTLSEYAEVAYKTDQYYDPASERSIRWDDPQLAIQWPINREPIVSAKDTKAQSFASADIYIKMGADQIKC
ncbi:MAG: dTDP-4-dehydrorhamnose 3,5-epimerase [Gammaproteobacteria bacterium]|nr:dTDP-4-dehydrorhamnose 3,5-epimerase [Gammaproteobacteria bacterium]MBU2058464.1 dTDP-4-dehydrorhamnose 3,5-epimerase [Gammaproteobacteria bacterium]MBU2176483.1 dTDP-4-dehydrorhamnose 3,5-epimerase [Gammaproteobacteria bacterium]MBU2248575.1 dTDP-4-dehydrorhamnose 3,5-epimerase [Gammaproteobacteria bacterium]MBU2345562.1 dTDP-4-dehydrorhamnose 3,5-epimerase [Gammaproteobacteria bacterium]